MLNVKRYQPPWDLRVIEFAKVPKQFFVARLHNLPTQPLARKESKIRFKKIKQLLLESGPVPSLGTFSVRYPLLEWVLAPPSIADNQHPCILIGD